MQQAQSKFDELYGFLRMVAKSHPGWIKQVDADASERPEMWGKQAFRVVFPDGQELWVQEVKTRK